MVFHLKSSQIRALSSPPLSSPAWSTSGALFTLGHHQSNGKAEAAVKTVKRMMSKCLQDGTDGYEALLELGNTTQQDTGLSPTQLMFGRLTRTRLPAVTNLPVNKKQSAILHLWRRHWWCIPKKQSAHSAHMHLECSRTTGPDEWLAAEPGRTWGCWEECEHYNGRQFTRLWEAFQCTGYTNAFTANTSQTKVDERLRHRLLMYLATEHKL